MLVAACGKVGNGAYVSVQVGDKAIDTVVLYLGLDPCTDQDQAVCAITPQGVGSSLAPGSGGGSWYRDANNDYSAAVSAGTAHFHIEASAADQTLQLVAVGLSGGRYGTPVASRVLRDVVVPARKAVEIDADLQRAAPLAASDGQQDQPDGDYVAIWQSQNPAAVSDCVVAEHWSGGNATRTFVVPMEDPDCDGYATSDPLECDPLWFDRMTMVARFSDSNCATGQHVANISSCVLGGVPCIDGKGTSAGSGMCDPVDPTTCVPQAVCNSMCAQPGAQLPGCFINGPLVPTTLVCTLYATGGVGTPCSAPSPAFTRPTTGSVDVSALLPGQYHLTSAQFAPTNMLSKLALDDKLFILPSSAELYVENLLSSGRFELQWNGDAVPTSMAGTPLTYQLMDLGIGNNNHMLLPIRIDSTECSQISAVQTDGIVCMPVVPSPGETITSCAM